MEHRIKGKKEALKALRQERSASISAAKQSIKEQRRLITKIKAFIEDQGKTIPEIARELREPTATVLIFVATLKKYGEVVEGAKEGDYFKYQLA